MLCQPAVPSIREGSSCESLRSDPDVRSCPWVVCGLASGGSELLRVETGEVGSGSHCVVCVGGQSGRPGMCIACASRTRVSMARTCLPTTCLRCGAVLLLGEGTRAEPHLPRARWQPATAGVEQHRGHGWRLVVNQLSKRALDILAHYDWTDKALHYRLSSTSRTSFHEHLLPQFRPPLPRPPHLLTAVSCTHL